MPSGHANEKRFVNKSDDLGCDDKDLCTYSDKCTSGICVGVKYACDLKERQKINTYMCATSLSCTGKFDGKAGGVCAFVAKAKNTPCGNNDVCAASYSVCDGKTSECPSNTQQVNNSDPVLHMHAAKVTILAPKDPKKLYTHKSGSYILDTSRTIVSKVTGVHASAKNAAQPSKCSEYTLNWGLYKMKGKQVNGSVAGTSGQTKSMDLTATTTSDLSEGVEYAICVQAINDVRNNVKSAMKCSNNILIDRSPPSTGTIGFYADATCKQQLSFLTSSPNTVHACWTNFKDDQSGVKEYVVTVSEIENKKSTAVKTVTVEGTKHTVAISGLSLRDGRQYQLSIVAFNYVNGQSSSQSSPLDADHSPPLKGNVDFVVDGLVSFLAQNER